MDPYPSKKKGTIIIRAKPSKSFPLFFNLFQRIADIRWQEEKDRKGWTGEKQVITTDIN